MRFGKRGNLIPRYIGPFEILWTVGDMAYELALPPDLSAVDPVFHVSMLRRYILDESYVIRWESVQLDKRLSSVDEPISILARDIQACLTAVTSVSDGLKGLYNEKLKPLERTYRFNDFTSPTLIQPCLTAVTSVSDGSKGLYSEKLKPLEQTYRFNDFASSTLTESDGHAFGSILDRKNQFYQILAKVQLSRKKALFNGTPDFSMPYNAIIITCTIFSLYFGSLLNALHRRTEEEERLLKSKAQIAFLLTSFVILRCQNLVEEKDKKVKELQDKIAAVNFTPESKMGKMLMAKCRTLQEENKEIGNQAN
ncbi:EH domain-containing protein 2 [Capsicum baccatum]|uniref:EH domain-containing protein 2 n=1 Tax=Capsicum baccatum TaxID=33114 RepID=A0A2G2X2P5_CAPBA|nr:EH domain-containing protein 2 [Capsicum baccatum]